MQSLPRFLLISTGIFLTILNGLAFVSTAFAEGTRTWEQSKFDDLTKGTATNVAIRSTGGLELAPTFTSLYATPSTYIWAMAADASAVISFASFVRSVAGSAG